MKRPPYTVLIVDDSAVVRQAMQAILSKDPDITVIGAASDPLVAANYIKKQVPDVITLDVEMPRMDGLTFLRRLMAQRPVPVVMCSSLVTDHSETLLQALEAGAVDVVCKPQLGVREFLNENSLRLTEAVKAAAQARLSKGRLTGTKKISADAILPAPRATAMARTSDTIVAIGASTGGTEALRVFLQAMPVNAPPIAIVQHMPGGFTKAFADRLNSVCEITVKEAEEGDRMITGLALIAPGNDHMMIERSGAHYRVALKEGPLVSRHRPSVDVLMRSVARSAGNNAIGLIMTGMGDDGSKGLLEMKEAGATTFGQDEQSCVVYGMPKVAKNVGAVMTELGLDKLPAAILQKVSER
ncbi:MAG: chemotaxis response regulator protein-glutamate methylesterase [Pelagimonas sp.]|jgi:two-component system chemotaxis response regulator CheB|nr:chemotaxis response regulator protein-glutamate methylesterase [Pelagimonas sp.]